MLGAYNYDGQTYTSTPFMSIRMPYRASGDDQSDDYASDGREYARIIPGYQRNRHLWTGEHQKNYVPIRDSDGWVRRYSTDRDEYRQRLNELAAKNAEGLWKGLQSRAGASLANARPNHPQPAQRPAQFVQQPQESGLDPLSDRINIVQQSQNRPSGQAQNQFFQQAPAQKSVNTGMY